MKYSVLSVYLLLVILLLSCEEVPVVINTTSEQGECQVVPLGEIENQPRQVLIEEFTGVKCVNCPDGSEALKELIGQYGDQLVAVSIHAGFFSTPYSESLYDFRTDLGNRLMDFLGAPLGYPAAIINRKSFDGAPRLHLGKQSWAGAIQKELQEDPAVRIVAKSNFDPATRAADIQVSLLFEESFSEEIRLSVLITENNVADYQETPAGVDPDYVHNHVLRRALTGFTGSILQEETTQGNSFCKSFATTIPAEWKVEDCEIVAFVHKGDEQIDVIQADAAPLAN